MDPRSVGGAERWAADRELTRSDVRSTLREQFTDLDRRGVEYLGSGWDYDAYLVGDDLVVRFPRRAEVAERLDAERRILDFVGTALEGAVVVPEIVLSGEASPHFPYRFFGHRLVPGVAADDPSVAACAALAGQLGDSLTAIHSIPISSARAIGIGPEEEGCEERREEAVSLVVAEDPLWAVAPEPFAWVASRPPAPPEYAGEPRFIHNDLCPEHIILDPATGALNGILDWSDVASGDPCLDFVTLVHWRGWDFAGAVLEAYRCEVDDGLPARLAFLSRILAVKWLVDASRRDGDTGKHLRWVKNAFAGGPS